MRARILIAVALGGIVGSLARLGIGVALLGTDPYLAPAGQGYPWPTLLVNLLGCLAIGLLVPVLRRPGLPAHRAEMLQAFLVTGILGGFTTFSAFAAESALLTRDRGPLLAVLYLVPTLVGGLLAVRLGTWLAGRRAAL